MIRQMSPLSGHIDLDCPCIFKVVEGAEFGIRKILRPDWPHSVLTVNYLEGSVCFTAVKTTQGC